MTGEGEWAATSGSGGHESPDASGPLSEPDEGISDCFP